MDALYQRFLPKLKAGAHILDAGCGSGRDARHFASLGFQVTAIDGSAAMARCASEYIGHPVRHLQFEALDYNAVFDGIWACASLLHIPQTELPTVMNRMSDALKNGGFWYLSFKYGEGMVTRNGRTFTNMTEHALQSLVANLSGIDVLQTWQTTDNRPSRKDEYWLNALLIKHPV